MMLTDSDKSVILPALEVYIEYLHDGRLPQLPLEQRVALTPSRTLAVALRKRLLSEDAEY